ncbi:P-loop containing nucleoside triphosphate hydrolase [Pseudocohnilembus persalinus]|uniref:p-loop containing nucleoside triphosphate hydrolase n=1 Tax=Pseudocohnilembus persalinus TaxID=266149 RepID=A0A0V0QMV1_PSEPJ|nr:P-loop containing nucleoside triphosphate hydrolase [Pseudocohnilembus persalinus]|eukprot:KRX03663.1 P-loop containing nucleoside triphosphate hydrolase [Pseudocohnilembus persalinus]
MATPKNSEQLDHIQVCIRVRPYNQREKELKANSCLIIEDKDIYLGKQDDEKKFSFDYIADQSVTQEQIYQEIGKPLSEAFQDGYNACVFAYGQTGAGKTHTIFGERTGTMHVNGLQTLVLKDIFEQLPKKIENASILASCCYFEIYNEKFIDLFSKDDKTTLTIKEDLKRGVYVEGLKHQYLNNYTEVMDLYKKGNQRRHVAETKMNLESSRSHCVFQFQIEIKNNDNGVTHTQSAKINFVDLAGSERQKQTEATGKRFEESKNINKSLTMLGRVINALGEKSKLKNNETYHIPFRDSKLTHILKDSLGGNTKCIMVANITQADISYAETLNTLKFAQRTKMISTRAQRNVETQGNVKMLQKEIKFLKQQIYEQEKAMKQMENAYTSENNKLQEQLNTQGDQNDQENYDENEEQNEDDNQQPTQQDMLDLIEEINRLKTDLEQKEYQLNLEQLKQTQLQEDLNYQQELNKLQEKQLDEKDQNIKDLTEQMSEAQELFDEMQSEHIKLQSEFEKLKQQQNDQQLKLEQKQKNEEDLKSQLEDAEKQNQEIQEKQRQIEKKEKSQQEEKDQKVDEETNQLKVTLNNQDIPSINENKSVFLDKKQNLQKLLTMRQKTGNQSVLEKTNTRVSFFDKNLSSNNNEAKIEKLEKENQFLHEKLKKYKQLQTKLLSNESFVKGNDSYSFYQQQAKQQFSQNSQIPNKFQVFKNSGNTNQSVFIAPIKSKKESQIQNRNQSQLKSFTRNFSMVDAYNASSFINFSQKQQLQKQQQNFSKMQTLGNSLNQSQKINESLDENHLIENPQMETYKQSGIYNNSQSLKKSQQIEQDNLQQSQQYEQQQYQQQDNNKKEEDEGHIPVNVEILEEQQRIKNQEEDALLNLMTENDNLKNLQEEMQEEISELKEDIIKLQDENDTLKETVLFISNQLNENRQSNLQMVSQLDNQGQKLLNSRSKTFSEKLNDKNQEEEQNNNLQQKLKDENDFQQKENYNQLETIEEEEINQSTTKKNQSQVSNTNTNISSFIGDGNDD